MPTVLAVDDSRSIRSLVTRALAADAIEVVQAENGQVALDLLAARSVDLVLLDVTMPGMDGITCLRSLRERGDRTAVVMLTSESNASVVETAHSLGVADYLTKPFDGAGLRAKVLEILAAHARAA